MLMTLAIANEIAMITRMESIVLLKRTVESFKSKMPFVTLNIIDINVSTTLYAHYKPLTKLSEFK